MQGKRPVESLSDAATVRLVQRSPLDRESDVATLEVGEYGFERRVIEVQHPRVHFEYGDVAGGVRPRRGRSEQVEVVSRTLYLRDRARRPDRRKPRGGRRKYGEGHLRL